MRDRIRMCPVIHVVHSQHERDEQHDEDRQRRGDDLGKPTNHHAPTGSGQMLEQHEEQRPQRQAQKKTEVDQVRAKELQPSALQKADKYTRRQREKTHKRRGARDSPRQLVQSSVLGSSIRSDHNGAHLHRSLDRSSGGTSSIRALWLRWSARTYAIIAQRSDSGIWSP